MNTVQDISFGIVPVFKEPDGSFLFCIVRHSSGQHWGFPKGHKDSGETDVQTARRELSEEVGITNITIAPDMQISESYVFVKNDVRHEKTVKYFIGFTNERETCTQENFKEEIIGVQWLPYKELLERLSFSEAKEVAKKAMAYLQNQT